MLYEEGLAITSFKAAPAPPPAPRLSARPRAHARVPRAAVPLTVDWGGGGCTVVPGPDGDGRAAPLPRPRLQLRRVRRQALVRAPPLACLRPAPPAARPRCSALPCPALPVPPERPLPRPAALALLMPSRPAHPRPPAPLPIRFLVPPSHAFYSRKPIGRWIQARGEALLIQHAAGHIKGIRYIRQREGPPSSWCGGGGGARPHRSHHACRGAELDPAG
jgi:hypothetical protein